MVSGQRSENRTPKEATMSSNPLPPRMLSAPLRLTAMTLRGLGPYLHGQRLEIKPLTILCGENGSGKSTWIEMLRRLKWTVEQQGFPFAYLDNQIATAEGKSVHSRARSDLFSPFAMPILLTEDLFQIAKQEKWQQARREVLGLNDAQLKQQEEDFGPPGCIGLEIAAKRSFEVSLPKCDGLPNPPQSAAERFIWQGAVEEDSSVRVRWAIFDVRDTELRPGDGLSWLIEIALNKDHVIRLVKKLDRARIPFDINEMAANSGGKVTAEQLLHLAAGVPVPMDVERHYILECSESFLFGNSSTIVRVGTVFDSGDQRGMIDTVEEAIRNRVGEHVARAICGNFLDLLRQLLKQTLSGFFQIGAIRYIQEGENSAVVLGPRYKVDSEEETAFQDEMKLRELAYDDREIGTNRRYVGVSGKYTQRVYADWAYNLMRQPIAPFTGQIDNTFTTGDFSDDVTEWGPSLAEIQERLVKLVPKEVQRNEDGLDDRELIICVLNSVLHRRNLFHRQDAKKPTGELLELIGTTPKEQIERLLMLSDDEVLRLNRLFLESQFVVSDERRCKHKTGYPLETLSRIG